VGATWQSRIVGEGEADPRALTDNPLNWRRHPELQGQALEEALERLGWIQRVVVNRRTGRLIDGHLRVELARRRGEERVPVLYVDLDEAEERLALATLDPLSALAETDTDQLMELLADVDDVPPALGEMLADLADVDLAGGGGAVSAADVTEAEVDRPVDELQRELGTAVGQVWVGDNVTLVIGDATDERSYASLNGELEAVWTDPPYGVDLGAKNRFLQRVEPARRDTVGLKNDDLDEGELREMLHSAFTLALERQRPGGAWYVAAPPGPLQCLFGGVLAELGVWRQTLIWAKNNSTFSPLGVAYHWGHEPIFYGWKPGGKHADYTDRTQTTVWQVDRPTASPLHPSTKPVELVARALEHSTRPGDLVLDPFAGSGTTAVAAAQMDRRAYVIELDPAYAAAIISRLESVGVSMRQEVNGGE